MGSTPVLIVDWSTDEPVYLQIARQIRALISSGRIEPGTLLPSVRALASDLGVNLNTVARAYRILEEEAFVVLKTRRGTEVASPASKSDREVVESLQEQLGAVLARMRQAGVRPGELRRRTEREVAALERAGG